MSIVRQTSVNLMSKNGDDNIIMIQENDGILEKMLEKKRSCKDMCLIVSIENDRHCLDSFWNDQNVKSVIKDDDFVVLRVPKNEANEFGKIYDVSVVPMLFVFLKGSDDDTPYTWDNGYPSTLDFYELFKGGSDEPHKEKKVKIAIYFQGKVLKRDFSTASNVSDVRQWIESEFGSNLKIFVQQKQKFLDPADTESVEQAGLYPSAFLRLFPNDESNTLNDDPSLQPLSNICDDTNPPNCLHNLLSFFAPFNDYTESEDLFQQK